jgi:hypothetical protein
LRKGNLEMSINNNEAEKMTIEDAIKDKEENIGY